MSGQTSPTSQVSTEPGINALNNLPLDIRQDKVSQKTAQNWVNPETPIEEIFPSEVVLLIDPPDLSC